MNAKQVCSSLCDSQSRECHYLSAQAFLQGYASQNLIQNDNIKPVWIKGSDCFWYTRTYKIESDSAGSIGKEYRLVDSQKQTNSSAFDHAALANALASTTEQNVNAHDLPLSDIALSLQPLIVSFSAYDQRWQFDVEKTEFF